MTRWDSERTIDRMTGIIHPERKKQQEGPFGVLLEGVVPHSPRGKKKNAGTKSKWGLQVRKRRNGLPKKNKGRTSV